MEERQLYKPIGEWLIEEKGCQSNDWSNGYTNEPSITHPATERVKKPDVVGVQYTRRDTTTPRYDFHFHFVEVKADTEPRQVQTLIGEIESLREHVQDGQIAADTASFYVALPTETVPQDLRNWAQKNGVGILTLNTSDDPVIVRETISPEPVDRGTKRSRALSNTDQQSPGNFKDAVHKTAVLKNIIDPEPFFDNLIRPEQEQLQAERDRQKTFDYIDDTAAEDALHTVISYLEDQDGVSIRSHSNQRTLFVETPHEEQALQIRAQKRNFKIIDGDGDLLFRIASENSFEITQKDIDSLPQLKSYLQKTLL
jgi:hypothetical protein